jgi:SulP family sulfate permease
MAIISLMTASALAPLAPAGSQLYVTVLAAQLALLSGAMLLACGLLRIGLPGQLLLAPGDERLHVGSAIVIAFDQVHTLLGRTCRISTHPQRHPGRGLLAAAGAGAAGYLAPLLQRLGLPPTAADIGAKLAPMLLVMAASCWWPVFQPGWQMGVHATAPCRPAAAPEPGVVERALAGRCCSRPC